jgi:hypothetical protein
MNGLRYLIHLQIASNGPGGGQVGVALPIGEFHD